MSRIVTPSSDIAPTTTAVKPVKAAFSLGKDSELLETLKQVQQRVGRDSAVSIVKALKERGRIPSGVFVLDYAMLGGLEEGTAAMMYGWESSGKTTLAYRYIAEAQKKYPDKAAVFIDVEGTFDKHWASANGVNVDSLYLVNPETTEQVVDVMPSLAASNDVSIITLDSLAAMAPEKELGKSAADATVAENARLINKLYRSMVNVTARERGRGHLPVTLFINQFRSKIGVSFGDSRVLPGGAAMKYYASTQIEIRKVKEHTAKDTDDLDVFDSNDIAFKLTKVKDVCALTAGEFNLIRNAENTLGYGALNETRVVATYAKRVGLIAGGGASWKIEGCETKFGKLAEIEAFFLENEIFFTDLKRKIISRKRKMLGLAECPPTDGYLLRW